MATKKLKGQKIDLAAFGPANDGDILSRLPSAPSGIERDPNERRGGRGGGDRYGDRGGGRSDDGPWGGGGRGGGDGGFGSEDGPWGRSSGRGGGGGGFGGDRGCGDRGGGGYGGDRGGGDRGGGGYGGDRGGGGYGGDRGGGDRGGGGYGGDRGGSDRGGGGYGGDRGGGDRGGGYEERPAHMRLNLTSSRVPPSMPPAPPSGGADPTPAAAAAVDKFSKAFGGKVSAGTGMGMGMERSAPPSRSGDARSSNFSDRPSGGYGGDRGGGSYRRNDDIDGDSRFANRFGGGVGGGGGGGQSVPMPLLPQKTDEELKAEADAKAAKAAKKALREEADRKEKEAKEAAAAAKAAAIVAQKEADAQATKIAASSLANGVKGEAFAEYLSGLSAKPTGAALVAEILTKESDPNSLKWCSPSEYGAAIKSLVQGQPKEQMRVLYAIQAHCHKQSFPKLDVKGAKRGLIELLFQLLFQHEVIEDSGFLAWADDDNDEVPGRVSAIVQTTEFIRILTDVEVEEYDEDAEEDEIDAPMETVV